MKPTLNKKSKKKYVQCVFRPLNPLKYKGTLPIISRSSLELKVMRWLDRNPNIISWKSESTIIPYQSPLDGKLHRYFVDLTCTLKQGDKLIKLLIEVKPFKFTQAPVITKRKSKKTILFEQVNFATNTAKWLAAKEWCAKKGYQFLILTEKDINS